jgi:membrane protease YdiL (CAAX protease family)
MTMVDRIRAHSLVAYYVLTFAISWGAILVAVGPVAFLSTTGSSPSFALVGILSLLGPSIAGLVLTGLLDGRAGLRDLLARIGRWRVGLRWYAVALLTAPLVNAATLFILSLWSTAYVPTIVASDDKVGVLLSGIGVGVFVVAFEEVCWTGFATPRFRSRHGVVTTGLIMGVLWGLWHLPLFAGNAGSSGTVPSALLVGVLLFGWLPPYRILMVWVYDRTQSLLVVMLMHLVIVVGQFAFAIEAVSPEGLFTSVLAYSAALWLAVGAVALANGGHITRERRPAAGSALPA